ncbi:MAG: hypothetical protein JWP81_1440 [Ferruginibacter sp.]|nr:hypothetical protein [Ferruginibacter sp.]
MERLCKQAEDKLCTLLSFLTQLPGELEMIADEIDNENLRNALCAVAIESNQYASELNAQLRSLAIIPPAPGIFNLEEELIDKSVHEAPKEKGKELLTICEKSEAFFSELYEDVLNDFFPNALLKNMMQYQMLGIKSAFMRIRFLNSLRFLN